MLARQIIEPGLRGFDFVILVLRIPGYHIVDILLMSDYPIASLKKGVMLKTLTIAFL